MTTQCIPIKGLNIVKGRTVTIGGGLTKYSARAFSGKTEIGQVACVRYELSDSYLIFAFRTKEGQHQILRNRKGVRTFRSFPAALNALKA